MFQHKKEEIIVMLDEARDDILNGSAIDFAARLRAVAVRP